MAYSYEEHLKQQEARRANSTGAGNGPEVHFMGEYLANDGEVVVVRFPYTSMADVKYTSTHLVPYPGRKFGARVRCEGTNCSFCAEGSKVEERVFVKALVYLVDDASGNVIAKNVVWDRAAAFADIDIKNLIDEYGSLRDKLFKIKRSGSGQGTRYTIMPIMNATVYNPEVYKADFTELDTIDAEKILSKSFAQYQTALNPEAAPATTETAAKTVAAPAAPVSPTVKPTIPETQTISAAPTAPTVTTEAKRTRYTF